METNQEKQESTNLWSGFKEFMKGRFSLEDDKALSSEVIANIEKGVVFRGVNLWVLIFATMIASLGLNVNSAAVIIGAMLISPIMGPIMGVGLSLGINDFDLMKKSLRNYTLMFIVAIITSTLYFLLTPLGKAQSELLARTVPTTYDVLIALFGGLAGIVAQTRKDRTSTVIPGVAIATALVPPLCTAGYGIATGQFNFFIGAFYLFFINSVFIALATFVMVRFLKYDKKQLIDKAKQSRVNRMMLAITLITFIPSVFIGLRMVRISVFESTVERYVDHVFAYPNTRVVDIKHTYTKGDMPSQIELMLVGEPLSSEMIENAEVQLVHFGLNNTELVVRQPSGNDKFDLETLQKNYVELLDEKNRRIEQMQAQITRFSVVDADAEDISAELGAVMPSVRSVAVTKSIYYDTKRQPIDTVLVCLAQPNMGLAIDTVTLRNWLAVRTKISNVKLYIDKPADE